MRSGIEQVDPKVPPCKWLFFRCTLAADRFLGEPGNLILCVCRKRNQFPDSFHPQIGRSVEKQMKALSHQERTWTVQRVLGISFKNTSRRILLFHSDSFRVANVCHRSEGENLNKLSTAVRNLSPAFYLCYHSLWITLVWFFFLLKAGKEFPFTTSRILPLTDWGITHPCHMTLPLLLEAKQHERLTSELELFILVTALFWDFLFIPVLYFERLEQGVWTETTPQNSWDSLPPMI